MKMGKLSQHSEWLSLIDISGPFLTVSLLEKAFPQGLETVEIPRRQMLRAAYEEWREAVDQEDSLLPELHREWIRLVLTEILEYDHESLVQAIDWTGELPSISSQEHAGVFRSDWIIRSPLNDKPRLFIAVMPPDTDFESLQRGDGWPVSLQERMTLLCRTHDVRLGLLTDGERWMLVNAPVGSTSSQASWYARLWFQEPITLKAFKSLLSVRRCFGPAKDTMESLLDESLKYHEEVTDTLGEQVCRAVEVLVQCLDKADEDRNRELLRDVRPAELYEAGLTVMMRLVFILCAEERGLLLLGDSIYDRCYAVSTLRGQLSEEADRYGPEVLDRRYDAWARVLAMFRAVYGGIEHESLRIPALGGSLFDPDRFPFLEGRRKGTHWRDTSAAPLPIDNRTVLLLLNSLQILEQSSGALLLSYRALDVEQIGHVYEGLLEHTVARVPRVTLGMQGAQKAKNPNIALVELESARLEGEAALLKLVLEITGRSESAIKNELSKPADETIFGRVLSVCGGDTELSERIRPFTNLLRTDAWDDPIVYRKNSFMVTLGTDRRETGTHYTPKSLTESIVNTTLEPVVYVGPAEGKPREEWVLKSSYKILDLKVCDPAMGSGAFLVQVCRYLGEKLVEAWLHEESAGKAITVEGEVLDQLGAAEPMPSQLDERLTIARRLVAERCLYGVDINPLAVELAKLSIWLVTLAKGRPFGFLDHNFRSGDSLLGIHQVEQLTCLQMKPWSRPYQISIFGQKVEVIVNEAIELRKRLRATIIRDINDVQNMAHLECGARRKLENVELIANAMIGEALRYGGNATALNAALDTLATMAGDFFSGNEKLREQITHQARIALSIGLPEDKPFRKPFHWVLEFPEVFEYGGFDAIVGNPPFMGGQKITGSFGANYREYLVEFLSRGVRGSADLCAYFFLRLNELIKSSGGALGLLSTNTISQGDTREVGLEQLHSFGSRIIAAIPSSPWPGKAALEIAQVWLWRGKWEAKCMLNCTGVQRISPFLNNGELSKGKPYRLQANSNISFIGSIPLGAGFLLTPEQAFDIIEKDERNTEVLKPYLSGDDLLSNPDQSPSRWVIDFGELTIKEAREYVEPFKIVEQYVKPVREKDNRKTRRERWWQFAERSPALYRTISGMRRVLFHSFTSKYVAFAFVPANQSFAGPHIVIASEQDSVFALLQSSIHDIWAREWCSTHETRLRYAPSDLLLTFPFPVDISYLTEIGRRYNQYRYNIMQSNQEGLTKTYNRFHDPSEKLEVFIGLRTLRQEMDEAVLSVYGWDDLNLGHGFYETIQGTRYTVNDIARREVLNRLLDLNHQRYKDEHDQQPFNNIKTKK